MKNKFLKRMSAMLMTTVMAAGMVIAPVMVNAEVPTVDRTMDVDFTIHKYEKTSETLPVADGTIKTLPNDLKALANIEFKVYKTNIDITPDSSFANISVDDVKNNGAIYGFDLDDPDFTMKTDEDGEDSITIAAADQGVYLVMEVPNSAVEEPAVPFLVSLPMTNPNGESWNYDVHVYPKNIVKGGPDIDKDVSAIGNDDSGYNVGDEVEWIIRPEIPADLYFQTESGEDVYAGTYKVTDVLDANLKFVAGSISFSLGDTKAPLTLTAGTHYTFTDPGNAGGGTLVIDFTDAGKKVIQTSAGTETVLNIHFKTEILEGARTVDYIQNNATLDYTNSAGIVYTPSDVPEDKIPEIHTGGAGFTKLSKNTGGALDGAEFRIVNDKTYIATGEYIKIDPVTKKIYLPSNADYNNTSLEYYTVTTDNTGKVKFNGLAYGEDGLAYNDDAAKTTYWIVETKAPAGYELLKDPVEVEVFKNSGVDTVVDGTNVYNVQKFTLPLTGGMGTAIFTVAGLILIAAAGILLTKSHKKNTAK